MATTTLILSPDSPTNDQCVYSAEHFRMILVLDGRPRALPHACAHLVVQAVMVHHTSKASLAIAGDYWHLGLPVTAHVTTCTDGGRAYQDIVVHARTRDLAAVNHWLDELCRGNLNKKNPNQVRGSRA